MNEEQILTAASVPGAFVNDGGHEWTQQITYVLDDVVAKNVQKYMTEKTVPDYNMVDFNCTTWAVYGVAGAALKNPPTVRTFWTLPSAVTEQLRSYNIPWYTEMLLRIRLFGYTPADAGQDIASKK